MKLLILSILLLALPAFGQTQGVSQRATNGVSTGEIMLNPLIKDTALNNRTNYLRLPRFDVTHFGAQSGLTYANATNDQQAIQAAIDAAGVNGGRVYFPPGVYGLGTNFVYPAYVTETFPSSLILSSNNVYLECDAPGTATLTQMVWKATGQNMIGAGADTGTKNPVNCGIINLQIIGSVAENRDMTQFQATTNTLFKGCIFRDGGQDAIDVQGGASVFVYDCYFSNMVANSISSQNLEVFVDGFEVNGGATQGGDFDIFSGFLVAKNGVFRGVTNAVNSPAAEMIYLDNIVFLNPSVNTTNILIKSKAIVSRCYFVGGGSSGAAICISTNSGSCEIKDNLFLDRGIVALTPDTLTIEGNNFSTTTAGIRLHGGSDEVIIAGNKFISTEGVRTFGNPSHRIIYRDNYTEVNWVINNAGTNGIFIGNSFKSCALQLSNGDGERARIMDNLFYGGTGQIDFTGLNAQSGALIKGNVIDVFDFDNTAAVTFEGNSITTISGNATGIANSVNSGNVHRSLTTTNMTNATATPANTELIHPNVISGKKYMFRVVLYVSDSTAADGARFDFDGGTAGETTFRVEGTPDGAVVTGGRSQTTAKATDFAQTTAGTGAGAMRFEGILIPSSTGTFVVRAAQNTHSTGTLTVSIGSSLEMWEIP